MKTFRAVVTFIANDYQTEESVKEIIEDAMLRQFPTRRVIVDQMGAVQQWEVGNSSDA